MHITTWSYMNLTAGVKRSSRAYLGSVEGSSSTHMSVGGGSRSRHTAAHVPGLNTSGVADFASTSSLSRRWSNTASVLNTDSAKPSTWSAQPTSVVSEDDTEQSK